MNGSINPQTQNVNNQNPSNWKTFELWDSKNHCVETVQAKKIGKQWMARCPKHFDGTPSLSINETKGLFFCHGCKWKGKVHDPTKNNLGKPTATYVYKDENGNPQIKIERFSIKENGQDKKIFVTYRHEKKKWLKGLKGTKTIPYRLELLSLAPDLVIIVEGEKDTDNLLKLDSEPHPSPPPTHRWHKDFWVTTNPFGAGKWRPEFSQYFSGKDMILIPDNDLTGFTHAEDVHNKLTTNSTFPLPRTVKILNPDIIYINQENDISDWIKGGGTLQDFLNLLRDDSSYINIQDLQSLILQLSKDEKKERLEKLLNSKLEDEKDYSAQEFRDGKLIYGVVWNKEKIILRSDGTYEFSDSGDHFKFNRSKLTREVWKRFQAGEEIDGKQLLSHLQTLFLAHIIFEDTRTALLLSIWVIGTYMFRIFYQYGYLWLNSPFKRCGKTLLLDIILPVTFNASSRIIDPTASTIYREITMNCPTMLIDEVEKLRGEDKERYASLMAIINAGFEREGMVPRTEKRDGEFVNINYPIYSPKVLASISKIDDTTEDRCFRIAMMRKKKGEKPNRFDPHSQEEELRQLREDLYLFALKNAEEISRIYNQASTVMGEHTKSLDDRARDIWEPLLSIASFIDMAAGDINLPIYWELVGLAKAMGKMREARDKIDDRMPTLIEILERVVLQNLANDFISSEDLLRKILTEAPDTFDFVSTRRLASYLSKFNLFPHHDSTGKVRGYTVDKDFVEDLKVRYL
jgi:hypothetical protein